MKQKYINIAIVILIVVILVINWKSISEKGKNVIQQIILSIFKDSLNIPNEVKLDCNAILKKGIQSAEVLQLQQWMLMVDSNALPKYGADGDFGSETLSALQKMTGYSSITLQKAHQLINEVAKKANITIPSPC